MRRHENAAILIVDNDPELAKVLAFRLSNAGHLCVTANSAAQALAAWQERSFDLVISDLNMPNGDGIDLAESLRRSEAVPIIFITGFKDDYERQLKSVENLTVLEKPFEMKILLNLIDAALDGKVKGDDGLRARASVGSG